MHRIRSKLKSERKKSEGLSRDIDRLEKEIRDAEFRAEESDDDRRRLTQLYESERQNSREKGCELDILKKQVLLLTEIIERNSMRVKSEMRVYADLIEGDRDAVNPGRVVAQRLREM